MGQSLFLTKLRTAIRPKWETFYFQRNYASLFQAFAPFLATKYTDSDT
ncbi:hypothetical protein EV294_102809 [Paenibacillus sp. BK033]|nr:hypothetical protein [Paenibacillus sp. BK720]TCM99507.1 hypothetical protein EV294_102809 [Paenibacillus sp. BK033]